MNFDEWKDFTGGEWRHCINVRSFIQNNYTPYEGDASFLACPTSKNTETMEYYFRFI